MSDIISSSILAFHNCGIKQIIAGDHLAVQCIPAVLVTNLFLHKLAVISKIGIRCRLKGTGICFSIIGKNISACNITQIRIHILYSDSAVFSTKVEGKIFIHICFCIRVDCKIILKKCSRIRLIGKVQIEIYIICSTWLIIKNSLHRFLHIDPEISKCLSAPGCHRRIHFYCNISSLTDSRKFFLKCCYIHRILIALFSGSKQFCREQIGKLRTFDRDTLTCHDVVFVHLFSSHFGTCDVVFACQHQFLQA